MTNELSVFENYNNLTNSGVQKAYFNIFFFSSLSYVASLQREEWSSALENLQRRAELYTIFSYNFRGGFITRLNLNLAIALRWIYIETDIDIL